jgi:hypothetical protein
MRDVIGLADDEHHGPARDRVLARCGGRATLSTHVHFSWAWE